MMKSDLPYSIEAAVNGHSFTVSGPDPDWVERMAKATFGMTQPSREDRRTTGFQASVAGSQVEMAQPRHRSGWIGYDGPEV